MGVGAPDLGRADKLDWEHTFKVDGTRCSMASQKFGLRLYVSLQDVPEISVAAILADRIVAALIAGQKVVERDLLGPLGEEQVTAGNLTVRNQYAALRRTYDYFRKGAEIAYAGHGRLHAAGPAQLLPPEIQEIIREIWEGEEVRSRETEGWWNTFAMVTAYFSVLEHVMVGLLPFSQFDPSKDSVKRFMGSKWGDKFKRVFNPGSDRAAQRHYLALKIISDQYRNPYSHGGFDKPGSALGIHIPGIGVVPATLSDIRDSPHFNFVPTQEKDFRSITDTFDELEKWIAEGDCANGWTWVTNGLDLRFDEEFRTQAESARDDFQSFVNSHEYNWERQVNMDW
ncbi:hypothetical protein [Arthrobacter sp. VKM Ac-2550]|uniref:hypothetical protein n=1 Tax=Crystallibacter permensis TaxID=1938888 RepID=UPI0022277ABB|nr:hypothetical protein [Arthrobacter sp. VKM Ac-2550]MCW2133377.1 hypothetical protein [Arthrobacter sp. VKM Ac-2550]